MDERILFAIAILIASLIYGSYIRFSLQNRKQLYLKILKQIEEDQILVKMITKKLLSHIRFISMLRFHTTICVILSFINIMINIDAIEIVIKYSYYILFIASFINVITIKQNNLNLEKKILSLLNKKQKEN